MADDHLIRRALREGARKESEHFSLCRLRSSLAVTQFCLRVPRSLGNAVRRNRIKRLMREFIRTHKPLWPDASAVVLIPKTGADRLNGRAVTVELEHIFADE